MAWLGAFIKAAKEVAREADTLVAKLATKPDGIVVNVHSYAWAFYERFLRAYYPDEQARVVALSMNPARNGAVQSGIAFTDAPTARTLLPGFDEAVRRPPNLVTERVEMSGQKIRLWADRDFGGLTGLYQRLLFPIACPVAVLEGPNLLNVPIASLRGAARQAAEEFYEWSAPRLVRAAQPTGVFLLGDYAGDRWERLAKKDDDLARLPSVVTHHPAARIPNDVKLNDWSRALSRVSPSSAPAGSRGRATGARR